MPKRREGYIESKGYALVWWDTRTENCSLVLATWKTSVTLMKAILWGCWGENLGIVDSRENGG